ncbi:MAG: winged helix-turn-helix domain-containing protein [Brevirhabdus sp.]
MATAPVGAPPTIDTIRALGFVQLDSIQVVARAHHHILWSRDQTYREPMLDKLLRRRQVFEHFTHDASALHIDMLPLWQRQFVRMERKAARWFKLGGGEGEELITSVLTRIRDEGALCSRDFDTVIDGDRAMWQRPPHKRALDYLWHAGRLSTCHRDGITKFYDLSERVLPETEQLSDTAQIDGLCNAALTRMGFATLGEIQKFWDACDRTEVVEWAERTAPAEVKVQGADGSWIKAVAALDIEARVAGAAKPSTRLRILNPFDPAIRDRTRLRRLFGFDYTVEMFVPAAKRKWGYYVFPLLEGDRFVGRIDAKCNRASSTLNVLNHWWEQGLRPSKQRREKLEAELSRLGRLVGADAVAWP